jgi:hypothetical protein
MASTGSHDIVAAFKAITGKAASTLAAAGLPQKVRGQKIHAPD